MDKKFRLLGAGLAAFVIVFLVVVFIFGGKQLVAGESPRHVVLKPYFVEEYSKKISDYKKTLLPGMKMQEITLSDEGFFHDGEITITAPPGVGLRFNNTSTKTLALVVTSPSLDGTSYALSQFALLPGESVVVDMLIPPYLSDVASKANVEKTDKGILVFEISCTNCNETSNYLKVYAKVS